MDAAAPFIGTFGSIQMNSRILTDLSRSCQVALTTLAATDQEYCDRLQNTLVRGPHELLYWGVGPQLRRGDMVALYTPKSKFLPDLEHSRIRRLYFAASDSSRGSEWNQHVFLTRRVDLEPAITYRELTTKIGFSFRDIVGAGRATRPLAGSVLLEFLSFASERCTGGLPRLLSCAERAKATPDVCISYSGQDWTLAHRLKLWLDAAGIVPFFVSPVGGVLPVERRPLTELLVHTFSKASVVVLLVPEASGFSPWIKLELEAALTHARRLILVRSDESRPWPTKTREMNVVRYELGRAQERPLVAEVKRELVASNA